MLVFKKRVKPDYPEKNLSEQGKGPTTNLTQGVDARIRTQAKLVGGECSHHCAIPCSSTLTEVSFAYIFANEPLKHPSIHRRKESVALH